MLPFPLKSMLNKFTLSGISKHNSFLGKLFAASCVVHLVLMVMLFVVYGNYKNSYKIELHHTLTKRNVPVIFLPLHKSLAPSKAQLDRLAALPSAVKEKIKKKEVSKKKGTTLKTETVKKEPAKILEKKNKKEKIVEKKQVQKPVDKVVEKKQPEPVAQKPVDPPTSELRRDLKVAEKPVEQLQQNIDAAQAPFEKLEPIYVGKVEWDALQTQDALQEEVGKHWSPPVGIAADTMCEITVQVDGKGVVQNVIISKQSGVLMYDIAARTAVEKLEMPKVAWGKELTIIFKQ